MICVDGGELREGLSLCWELLELWLMLWCLLCGGEREVDSSRLLSCMSTLYGLCLPCHIVQVCERGFGLRFASVDLNLCAIRTLLGASYPQRAGCLPCRLSPQDVLWSPSLD